MKMIRKVFFGIVLASILSTFMGCETVAQGICDGVSAWHEDWKRDNGIE